MTKDPAFLFYSGDFLNGVLDMTMEERGMYITLLCLQHQKGSLPEKTIRFVLGFASDTTLDSVLDKFDVDENGFYYNSRLQSEIVKRAEYTESRRKNGAKGGRPKIIDKPYVKPSEEPYGLAQQNHMRNENENINEDKDIDKSINVNSKKEEVEKRFDAFWEEYPRKVGKGEAKKSWVKIRPRKELFEKIMSAVLSAKNSTEWKAENGKYIPNPSTWLNQGRWDDELTTRGGVEHGGNPGWATGLPSGTSAGGDADRGCHRKLRVTRL